MVGQSPDEEFLLTVVATLSSSELKVRPACCTAARLTSKRTLFPSRTNWIMPPRLRELRHVTDCQDGLFAQRFDDAVKLGCLGGAQEKNLAIAQLL